MVVFCRNRPNSQLVFGHQRYECFNAREEREKTTLVSEEVKNIIFGGLYLQWHYVFCTQLIIHPVILDFSTLFRSFGKGHVNCASCGQSPIIRWHNYSRSKTALESWNLSVLYILLAVIMFTGASSSSFFHFSLFNATFSFFFKNKQRTEPDELVSKSEELSAHLFSLSQRNR